MRIGAKPEKFLKMCVYAYRARYCKLNFAAFFAGLWYNMSTLHPQSCKRKRARPLRKLLSPLTKCLQKAVVFARQHSLMIPTIVSFLSFIVAVLLIFFVWFTRDVTATLEDTLYENASFSSAKAAGLLEVAFQDMIDTAAHLEGTTDLSPRAFRDDPYTAYQTLRLFASAKYSDIVLSYKNNPTLLTIYGTCTPAVRFPEAESAEALLREVHAENSVRLLSTMTHGSNWLNNRLLLCYPLTTQYTAMFVLNQSAVTNLLSNAIGTTDGMQILFDPDGSVLWASRYVPEELQRQLFERAVSNDMSDRTLEIDQKDYIFSANAISYGARLVVLDRLTTQFDSLNTIIDMLIVICVVIFILGAVCLFYSVNRGYKPIASLVREIRTVLPEQQEPASDIAMLRHAYSQYSSLLQESQKNAALFSTDQLRSLFVLRTIGGRYTDAEELHNLCRSLEIDFPHPCFFACLVLFDETFGPQTRREIEERLLSTNQDIYRTCFYLLPDGHSAVGIINVPSDDPELLSAFGNQLLGALSDASPATLGLGQIYGDIASLGKSYLEAHAALDYRLIKGKNTWITYSEISFSSTAPAYPHQLINSYINTVRTWDVQGIREKLQQITDYIYTNNLPLQQVKCICFDLTSAFLREISSLDRHVTYKPNNAYDVFNIAEYDSVTELAQKIASFSENIQQYITRNNEYQASDLIRQCTEYMRSNIPNVQFSLSSCSEQFDIAPQTLRRKFKDATGQTLSSYMTSLRVERAKELLTSTELDVSAICEQCGYLDQSSFIRLFKSETGVSPGKYREMHQS